VEENEHFKMNLDLLNKKNKFGLNQKIIFYILKNKDRSVTYKEIAKKFKIRERNAYSRLDDLLKADIVTERAYGIVKGLKDKMLEMCLNVLFKPIIEDIDEHQVSLFFHSLFGLPLILFLHALARAFF